MCQSSRRSTSEEVKRLVRGALGQVEEAGKGQNIHSEENSIEIKEPRFYRVEQKNPDKYPIRTD